jgi:hypothetical protein
MITPALSLQKVMTWEQLLQLRDQCSETSTNMLIDRIPLVL